MTRAAPRTLVVAPLLIEVASKDHSRFHSASTARRPWKQLADTPDKTVVLTMSYLARPKRFELLTPRFVV